MARLSMLEKFRLAFFRRRRLLSELPLALSTRVRRRRRVEEPDGIARYERRLMSQNGEDGIVEEIFRRLRVDAGFFVEFGVEDGLQCNAAYLARYRGWSGVFIEGSDRFDELARNYRDFPNVKVKRHFITRENIGKIFQESGIPREFDLLSIDIDGNDYWVWQALAEYRPRVVIVEYNASYPPPASVVMKYEPSKIWRGTTDFGASLSAYGKLANQLGYSLIGTESKGVNAFFLRDDLVETSRLRALSPEDAFHPAGYGGGRGHRWAPGDFEIV